MAGNLVLAGRVKDTIVLSNGENVEPQPIEDACSQSEYIQFIVLYGQDRRALGALICKNQDAFEELEKTQGRTAGARGEQQNHWGTFGSRSRPHRCFHQLLITQGNWQDVHDGFICSG